MLLIFLDLTQHSCFSVFFDITPHNLTCFDHAFVQDMWMVEHDLVDSGEMNLQRSTRVTTLSPFVRPFQTLFTQLTLIQISRILLVPFIYLGISTCNPLTCLLWPRSFAGRAIAIMLTN
jgi:hypothetical protein